MQVYSSTQPVPPRALAISVAALAVPVAVVFWLPDWTNNGLGMLIWLSALIPAFLLSYYRGLQGVAVALAGGMAVITATQLSIAMFEIAEPNWALLMVIAGVYLGVSVGVALLAEALRRDRRAAEEMARIDRLTELPNRRHLEDSLEREFAAAERGKELAVVIFDLDHFKQVNDKHGHAAGDTTIKAFAKILKTNTRKENLSARFGGEEFVSVLRDADTKAATLFSQRVLSQMREWPLPWGTQTVSAGIACYRRGMGSFELLLSEADRALYEAKNSGRDRICSAQQLSAPAATATPSPAASPTPAPTRPPAPPPRRSSIPLLASSLAPAPSAAPGEPTRAEAPVAPISARIFLVDDDAAVRGALKRILIRGGHQLWDTGDALEAIRHFTEAPVTERPDLILTDVIMPVMTGVRMVDQIAKIDPDIKVIYMSGYVQSEIQWEGSPGAVVAFLEKPIEIQALLAAVQRVIRAVPQDVPG